MNMHLPSNLREFIELQVTVGGYESSGEYVRELIRKKRDVQSLRGLVLDGAMSPRTTVVDSEYFEKLRRRYGLAVNR